MAHPSPEPIMTTALGFMAAKQLFIADEVGRFEKLAAGPASLDELANKTGVAGRTLRIVADAMLMLGLVEKADGRYRNSPVAGVPARSARPAFTP